ncbi:MAG: pyridoxamine 5'-phosphate oxidase family protein [Oscillospiraceae bacterium]|nr:pyridoxamine 5'-phosphate oxidase family protein [Oscillospiraceae bacterium]
MKKGLNENMNSELIRKAGEIILKQRNFVLTLIDKDGYPSSSVATVSKADGVKWLTFCSGLGSNKANRTRNNNRACVCFASEEYSVSFSGDIEIITDPDVKKEMWYEGLEGHFKGYEDPDYCVFKFTTKRYSLFIDWIEEKGEL